MACECVQCESSRLRHEAAQQKALAKINAAVSAIKKGVVAEDLIWLLDAARAAMEE